MQEAGADEYDIKKMNEGLNETSEVLATCRPRIDNALEDLENLIGTYTDGGQLGEEGLALLKATPEWSAAEAMIEEAKIFVDSL